MGGRRQCQEHRAVRAALRKSDIEAILGTRPVAKTDHFVLHCRLQPVVSPELSTAAAPSRDHSVDIMLSAVGAVIPKRHARRAATRNLIKRQARELMRERLPRGGQYLIRLRSAFDPGRYPSAASRALREAVRDEIAALLDQCALGPCR